MAKYKRIMLKMSGEVLMGDQDFGIDSKTVKRVAQDIKNVIDMGVEVCVVVGAGNIFRGVSGAAEGMDRTTADYMGMLGICINALALQNALEHIDVYTRVQSAIRMDSVCEALHPPQSHAPHGKRPRCNLRRRHGQPIFYDRHCRRSARE